MARFWNVVNRVLEQSDIVVLVGDARLPEESMNEELIKKIERKRKKAVIVFNKADLVSRRKAESIRKRFPGCILVSALKHMNTMKLLRRLNELARGGEAVVGVVGYPNTGKSSVINAIKGRRSASTSSVSGWTKGKQLIRVTSKILLIDTPGVIPFAEQDEIVHAFLGVKNPEKLKDPDLAAMRLIEVLEGRVEEFYDVPVSEDAEETIERIALKMRALKKGGVPDLKRAAVDILNKWQKGKVR